VTSAPPATHAEVDGLAVVRRQGRSEGRSEPTVVFVHGAMDRAASFGRVMRRLPGLDTVAVDRRGYGGSVRAGVATGLADHARDLLMVIEWAGATSVVVVGHSLGGTIALHLAESGDPRVRGLALFEAPVPALDGSRQRIGGGAIEVGLLEGPAAAAEHFYRRMVGDATWNRLRERDREARRSEGPALLAELVDLRDGADVDPKGLHLPALVGVGERSGSALRSGSSVLADLLPRATAAEIPGAGHGAHLTHPDEFARYVRAAVTAALRPAAP
jgi:pimeloyl-ACP methyl ester carboxylesterase